MRIRTRCIRVATLFTVAISSSLGVASEHFAFQPLRKTGLPRGDAPHPIDRFIEAAHRERGVVPGHRADARTLVRRASFDLLGLPPTSDSVARFVSGGEYFPGLVDQLLSSPHYGERWGRHWMDVVRYADTAGENADYPIPEAYLYRDYIIDSFNADKPYDEFVREQLAGDLLNRELTDDHFQKGVIATGFVALARRYGTAPNQHPQLIIEDAIETTGRAFLGLTLKCARCHDHKSDPISTRDYYALYGIFESTQFPYAGSEEFASAKRPRQHFVPLVRGEALERIQVERAAFHQRLSDAENAADEPARMKLREANGRSDLPLDVPSAYAVNDRAPRDAQVQHGGNIYDKRDTVPRGVPAVLRGDLAFQIPEGQSGRAQLAEWLTASESPASALLARVMVNRIWHYHFGRGLVATTSNFGVSGAAPTHPELLEYLANYLIDHDWSVKAMHRLIMTSQTYQRSSTALPGIANDPTMYARFARRRLDAESIRDTIKVVAGTLDTSRPGGHPFPEVEQLAYSQHHPYVADFDHDHRSVYLMTQRIRRHPYLGLFDQADPNTSTGKRSDSTAPTQSLYLMNHPWIRAQAAAMASRIGKIENPEGRVKQVYADAFQRPPVTGELERALGFVIQVAETDSSAQDAWASLCKVILTSNEFLYVD